jgi:uncharacterized protein (TIGR00251 family)
MTKLPAGSEVDELALPVERDDAYCSGAAGRPRAMIWGVSSAARIAVRLQPRASRDEIVGLRDGVLVVRVTAPPVDGRANIALCKLVARRAGVGATRVSVVRGERSRDKLVQVEGIEPAALAAALTDDA